MAIRRDTQSHKGEPMDDRQFTVVFFTVLETVIEMGDQGAPSGVVYAGLMSHGVDFNLYQAIIRTLVNCKFVTLSGSVLRPTPAGAQFAQQARQKLNMPAV
jgi:hypothetical protein